MNDMRKRQIEHMVEKFCDDYCGSDYCYDCGVSTENVMNFLNAERTGQWIYHENDMCCVRWDKWECSECHKRVENKSDFCPECGAYMRGEQDD